MAGGGIRRPRRNTMSTGLTTPALPNERSLPFPVGRLYRLTVEQYQRMAEAGILTPDDRVELLEGWLVKKMTQHPPHAVALDYAQDTLRPLLPEGWRLREQKPIL